MFSPEHISSLLLWVRSHSIQDFVSLMLGTMPGLSKLSKKLTTTFTYPVNFKQKAYKNMHHYKGLWVLYLGSVVKILCGSLKVTFLPVKKGERIYYFSR